MGSVGLFVEMTITLSIVCAATLICIIQSNSLSPTYYFYVDDITQIFSDTESKSEGFPNFGSTVDNSSLQPEFEDSDWDLDLELFYDNQVLSFEDDEIPEGNLSILCWLAVEASYYREASSGQAIKLMWRAPCYEGMQLWDSSPSSECHIWVSGKGELTVSFADGEVAYRSNTSTSDAEHMVLSDDNKIFLLNKDRETIWSSRDNQVFNCID